jgi:GNAT superfamily N-acetyltransferase
MKVSDCREVGDVHARSWKSAYAGILPKKYLETMNAESSAKRCAIGFDINEDVLRFVATEKSKMVGFIMGLENRHPDLVPEARSEIWMLYVDPGHWGKGIGSALLKKFLNVSEGPVVIWALEKNVKARAFYEAMGGTLQTATHDFVVNEEKFPQVAYLFTGEV